MLCAPAVLPADGRCLLSMEKCPSARGPGAHPSLEQLAQHAGGESAWCSDACVGVKRDVTFWRPFGTQASEATTRQALGARLQDRLLSPVAASLRLTPSPNSAFRPVRVKRLQCTFCGVSFLNNGQLVGHIRIHTGDKPYKCGACWRAFARNEELTRHRRIHSGEKPHACDVCKKRFGRKDHLNKHRNTHLKDSEKQVYLCRQPGCGHRYTRTDALARHQWTAHSIRRASPVVKDVLAATLASWNRLSAAGPLHDAPQS